MDWPRFRSLLKKVNGNFVFTPHFSEQAPGAAVNAMMVYLRLPNHPEANREGLIPTLSVASPGLVPNLPDENFRDHTGRKNRGAKEFFRILLDFRVEGYGPVLRGCSRTEFEKSYPKVREPLKPIGEYKKKLNISGRVNTDPKLIEQEAGRALQSCTAQEA